jgi:hypothetical protein
MTGITGIVEPSIIIMRRRGTMHNRTRSSR